MSIGDVFHIGEQKKNGLPRQPAGEMRYLISSGFAIEEIKAVEVSRSKSFDMFDPLVSSFRSSIEDILQYHSPLFHLIEKSFPFR
jgi:hypothetical protein